MSRENPQGTILPLRTMISEIQIKIMCLDYTQSKKLKAEMGRGGGESYYQAMLPNTKNQIDQDGS